MTTDEKKPCRRRKHIVVLVADGKNIYRHVDGRLCVTPSCADTKKPRRRTIVALRAARRPSLPARLLGRLLKK